MTASSTDGERSGSASYTATIPYRLERIGLVMEPLPGEGHEPARAS